MAKAILSARDRAEIKAQGAHLQPIRFQGQSFDTETGLHYNRFRYFDPDLGIY